MLLPRHTTALALPALLVLGACASSGGGASQYPSLDIRESERVLGTMDAPPAPVFTPAPATPATLAGLDTLAATARAAHQRFLAAAGDARAVIRDAAGSATGSDGWARGQVAVAGLASIRSDAMIALADIDRIHVDAHVGGAEIARSEAVRAEVSALVAEQDRVIAGLLQTLGG
jgi:hypothetical protein